MRRIVCSLLLLSSASLLSTGCGFTADKSISSTPIVAGKGMHGVLMGGQQPVVGATVGVFGVSSTGSNILAQTTTDAAGHFEFNTAPSNSYSCGSVLSGEHLAIVSAGIESPLSKLSRKDSRVTGAGSKRTGAHPADLPDTSQMYTFIVAEGGDSGGGPNSSIYLAAGLGKCIDGQNETVEINEVTTAVFATLIGPSLVVNEGDFSNPDFDNAFDIAITNAFQTIIDLPTGTVKPNTVSTTGGTSITLEAAKIYSLANTLASCVNSADDMSSGTAAPSTACKNLFALSTTKVAGKTTVPQNTLFAAAYIGYQPFASVTELYQLAGSKPPFQGLPTAPNDWTIGISYSTPMMGLGIFPTANNQPTSSNIDIDSSGRVWFPSNKSGAGGIGYFDPTENAFNGPFGGMYLTRPQYIALDDAKQYAWTTDPSKPVIVAIDTTPGSEGGVTDYAPITDGYGGSSPTSTGPIFVDAGSPDYVYDASDGSHHIFEVFGQSATFRYEPTGITVNGSLGTDPNDANEPVSIAATSDLFTACNLETSSIPGGETVVVSESGACATGGAATGAYSATYNAQDEVITSVTLNSFCSEMLAKCASLPEFLQSPQGVAFDGSNAVWFANSANGSIFLLDASFTTSGTPDYTLYSDRAYLHGVGNGGTMIKPVGLAVDRAGNVWTSNATCTSPADTTCVYTLSEVFGVAAQTLTPLSTQAERLQGTVPAVSSSPSTSPMLGIPTLHHDTTNATSVLEP